jgi:hypothetical protein
VLKVNEMELLKLSIAEKLKDPWSILRILPIRNVRDNKRARRLVFAKSNLLNFDQLKMYQHLSH